MSEVRDVVPANNSKGMGCRLFGSAEHSCPANIQRPGTRWRQSEPFVERAPTRRRYDQTRPVLIALEQLHRQAFDFQPAESVADLACCQRAEKRNQRSYRSVDLGDTARIVFQGGQGGIANHHAERVDLIRLDNEFVSLRVVLPDKGRKRKLRSLSC